VFEPEESFTKTWRLINTGTCTWDSEYELVFVDGDLMEAPQSVRLTRGTVEPNGIVDISVNMSAPQLPGEYRGNWMIKGPSGVLFGLLSSGTPIFVEIEVVIRIGFNLEFDNIHRCPPNEFVVVRVENIGTEVFRSGQIHVVDLDTSSMLAPMVKDDRPFVRKSDSCPATAGYNTEITKGEYYYLMADVGPSLPSEYNALVSVILCTRDGMRGECLEQQVGFGSP
jgi:hypothetical protein